MLLDNLKQTHPTVVNELIPAQLNVGQVQRILQNLLAEGISIRNLTGILEKVSDHAASTKNPDELSEYARRALGSQIIKPFQMENGSLRAITLDPRSSNKSLRVCVRRLTKLPSSWNRAWLGTFWICLSKRVQQMLSAGHPPVVLARLRFAWPSADS